MTEIQKDSLQNTQASAPGEIVTSEELGKFNEWAGKADVETEDAAAAARRTVAIDSTPTDTFQVPVSHEAPTREVSPHVKANRVVAATAATVLGVAGLVAIDNAANGEPEFSEQTTTFTVQPGDGTFDAAQEIEGLNDMNHGINHIEADPANIDVLKDGLQPGEQLEIPVSVAGYEPDKK